MKIVRFVLKDIRFVTKIIRFVTKIVRFVLILIVFVLNLIVFVTNKTVSVAQFIEIAAMIFLPGFYRAPASFRLPQFRRGIRKSFSKFAGLLRFQFQIVFFIGHVFFSK